jgi:hypothetical protein
MGNVQELNSELLKRSGDFDHSSSRAKATSARKYQASKKIMEMNDKRYREQPATDPKGSRCGERPECENPRQRAEDR